jgi:hypothetical protein
MLIGMFPINSLSGALAQSAQVQIQHSAEKARQARKAQDDSRHVADRDDELEHQVENAEELAAIHDETPSSKKKRKQQQQHQQDEEQSDEDLSNGLDLQA